MILTTNYVAAAAKSAKGPPKTSGEKKADQIANGVEAMKIDDTPTAKSKNLDVLAEYKKSKAKNAANFVVIGKSRSLTWRLKLSKSRPCRCREKYVNGTVTVRPKSCGSTDDR